MYVILNAEPDHDGVRRLWNIGVYKTKREALQWVKQSRLPKRVKLAKLAVERRVRIIT